MSLFSVLIPSVPSRHEKARDLFDKIAKQAEPYDVEVLMLCDNKKRSIGHKRQALLDIAKGDYIAFVDDDDDIADSYVSRIVDACGYAADVICFDSLVTLNGEPPVLCRHDVGNPNQQYDANGFLRAPWHINAWKREIAQACKFPDLMDAEDWAWCEQALKLVQRSYKINATLYRYRFNALTTEAR